MRRLSALYKRIAVLTLAIVIFIIFGTVGFMHSEGLNLLDAIWYSVMTLTTVGFQVPNNFSDEGKIITIFLMLFGVGAVLYGLTALALEIFSGNIGKEYKINIIKKRMKNLENHIIICGFGRNGRQAARKLILHKKPFVIIDKKPLENRDDEFADTIFIHGNAIEDEVLKKAGIEKAVGIIASLPSDADNLFIVISSKELNPNIKVISRASNSNTIKKLKTAGAENVIMPDKIGGEHMASLLITPDIVEFVDHITLEGTKQINVLEIYTNRLPGHFINKKIEDLQIFPKTGCKIVGYKDAHGKYIINPDESKSIEANCCIFALGQPQQIEKLQKIYPQDLP
ncbi:potassium transporter TrkA [Cloacibacterium rupense]|uniref:Potassium transporter TrkA n=1 Tax=Cloacibacterium rupense TaxID=517423 RepID=A0ABQ2NH68_9FLAO|nr:potassium channel protein [Cloacibacterium rupense]GGP03264.1 potassium transporter TrkA [Cloacibacterium rupense]